MLWDSIRRLAVTLTLLMAVTESVAREDITPTVELGMSPDQVIDQLGSPHGRGAAGDREIWTYPHYRIVFEAGEVVIAQRPGVLTPSPPAGGAARAASASAASTPREGLSPTSSWLLHRPEPVSAESLKPTPVFIPNPPAAQVSPTQVAAAEPPVPLKRRVADLMVYLVGSSLLVLALAALRQIGRQRSRPKRPSKGSRPLKLSSDALTVEQLISLEWKRFTELTSQLFTVQGWRTEPITLGTDGNVHLRLAHSTDPSRRAYVSCKASQDDVDMMRVRDFYGTMTADGVREGWFLTTSNFTRAARTFAEGKPLKLMSGPEIVEEFGHLPETDRKGILSGVFSRN